MVCSNCGGLLGQEASFCPACGNSLAAGPPATDQRERAIFVFRATRKFSLFKQMAAYLVFFPDQLLVAHLSKANQKAETARVRQELKDQGMGFFKSSAAMLAYWQQYESRYMAMSPAAIQAECPENLLYAYGEIDRFYFRGYAESYDTTDNSTSVTKGKIQLLLQNGQKIKFIHNSPANQQLQQFFSSLFGSRLKYRR